MARIGIVGAGAMGLAAAYHACKSGHDVTVFERDSVPGGMAAHFDFDGISLERFYHFICKSDHATFDLLAELGLSDRLRWVDTRMGYHINGTTYPWGDPLSLLRFPLLSLAQKLRYGLFAFRQTKAKDFAHLENSSAKTWILEGCGEAVYTLLWKRLLELKFYEYTDNISAAWIATRIKRVGNSRKSMFQESLGYLEGGTQTLVHALVARIEGAGGTLRLGAAVEAIDVETGRVSGIRADGESHPFDAVICTVPTPLVSAMVPDLTEAEKSAYDAIKNIGVVCVLLKLKRSVTDNFWLNVVDDGMDIPGIIEFSNLRPLDATVVYVPYYMPTTNKKFAMGSEAFVQEALSYVRRINPEIAETDLIGSYVGRLRHSQPVCEPSFAKMIPPIQTSIEGLQIADTCFYYPEDRGISESVRLGAEMVRHGLAGVQSRAARVS